MKKKIIFLCCVLAIAAVAVFNVNFNNSKSVQLSNVSLADVEASANIIEWWNSNDYSCEPVICFFLITYWESLEAVYAGSGNGTVAHTWNCAGC